MLIDFVSSNASKGKGKKKEEKYELALPDQTKPYRVEQTVFVYKKKKKAKGASGQDAAPAERTRCGCQARLHALVNNCVRCGRIVCTREGAGACFHCGATVYAVSGEAAENVAAVTALESGASQKEIAGLQKAQEHLGRLLDYDQNAVRRTTVFDDQADYFDMSKWLSDEERKVLKQKEESIIREKEARKNMITIDFAGRKVVSEEAEGLKFEEAIHQQISSGAHLTRANPADSLLFNPAATAFTGVRPTFVAIEEKPAEVPKAKVSRKTDEDAPVVQPAAKPAAPRRDYARAVAPAAPKASRVQHEFFPETDVDLSRLDLTQLALEDLTSLDNAKNPWTSRGVLVSSYFPSIDAAKSVVGWLAGKKATNLVQIVPLSSSEHPVVPLSDLASICTAAGISLGIGLSLRNFAFGSEEALAKLRSSIHQLASQRQSLEFWFFFSGDLSTTRTMRPSPRTNICP